MKTVRIAWTQEGTAERQESAVTYSPAAAEDYKLRKAKHPGVTDVRIVPA
ncbi:hypothetical protein ACIQVO_36730 [Streptomyces sp. NPDC101062]